MVNGRDVTVIGSRDRTDVAVNELLPILGLALMPVAGNFLGGVLAEVWRPSGRILSLALHAAVGIMLAIVAVELLPEASGVLSGWSVGTAFVLGGVLYIVIDVIAQRLTGGGSGGSKRMWLIYTAVTIDLLSDGLMIGSGGAVTTGLALRLAAGQILADIPEGYAASASFRANCTPRGKRLLMMASFAVPVVVAAAFANLVLKDASELWRYGALAVIAGMLSLAAIEDMLGEAHEHGGDSKAAALAFVGGFALFVFVSAGLE